MPPAVDVQVPREAGRLQGRSSSVCNTQLHLQGIVIAHGRGRSWRPVRTALTESPASNCLSGSCPSLVAASRWYIQKMVAQPRKRAVGRKMADGRVDLKALLGMAEPPLKPTQQKREFSIPWFMQPKKKPAAIRRGCFKVESATDGLQLSHVQPCAIPTWLESGDDRKRREGGWGKEASAAGGRTPLRLSPRGV